MKLLKTTLFLCLALLICISIIACKKDSEEDITSDSEANIQPNSDTESNSESGENNGNKHEDDEFVVPTTVGNKNYKSIYDAYDSTNMLYWDSVTEADAKAYGEALIGDGYSLAATNENPALWSATYTKNGYTAHVYYLKRLGEFRALVSNAAKLPKNIFKNEKQCDALITQIGTDKDAPSEGMGYIIQLEDGSFVLIDGGYNGNRDAANLYKRLNDLKNANESEKIIVRAWFFTHGDKEHTGALAYFLDNYENDIVIEAIVANDPADEVYEALGVKAGALAYSSIDGLFGGCEFIKAHTGYKFSFAGVEINILYTHEDANELQTTSFDSRTSMVFDAIIGDTKLLWLGDLEIDGANRLESIYGNELDCDILQVSSGANSGSETLYKLCSPNIVFCIERWLCDFNITGGTLMRYEQSADMTKITFKRGEQPIVYTKT